MRRSAFLLLLAGALFALAPPAEARAGLILNEVFYDGDGADADDVFTELVGTAGMSLNGWSLRGINGSDGSVYRTISLTGMTVPSDGILVLATSSAGGSLLLARDYVASVDWQNGPDAIQLLDASGSIVDALQYGDAGVHNAGEGAYALDVLAGWSLTRNLFGGDTNDNLYDFSPSSTPTPGFGVAPASPEPATLVLVAAGGAGLAIARRRRSKRS